MQFDKVCFIPKFAVDSELSQKVAPKVLFILNRIKC
jgi:hypothetical protein